MNVSGLVLLAFLVTSVVHAQDTTGLHAVKKFQHELNDEYRDATKSPLPAADRATFTEHNFYPIDLAYRVTATLTELTGSSFEPMATTTSRLAYHRIYGYLEFSLKGKSYRVPVYQSRDLLKTTEYADYLFFPFTDETTGKETYGGGRYIDLRIPKQGNKLIIDFNQAYNPYCAYSGRFSCPRVPTENHLATEVKAGIKFKNH